MTDTGWTFQGYRVFESENAPDPNRIKRAGPPEERTMTSPRMQVLGLMAAAEPLWREACEEYSEGESVAIIRAQLELHRHAVELILERMETR